MALTLVSPIHRLPTELTSMIIEAACEPVRPISLPSENSFPLAVVLSRVCRKWRAIAHSRRHLWDGYILNFQPGWTPARFAIFLCALEQFLEYAPLTVQFHMTQGAGANDFDRLALIQVLTTHSCRIRALKLSIPQETAEALFTGPTIPFDRMIALNLAMLPDETKYSRQAMVNEPISSVLIAAPMLSEIHIGYRIWRPLHQPGFLLDQWNLPLSQLTVFSAPNVWMAAEYILCVFESCPQLTTCNMCCDDAPDGPNMPIPPPITLQHLRHLQLFFRLMQPYIWDFITAPNLVNLTVTGLSDDDYTDWPQDRFMAFKERSGFSLNFLRLRFDFTEQVDDIIQILQASPELVCLQLRWTQMYVEPDAGISRLLDHLARHPNRPLLLPNLRCIHLDATDASVRMVASRCLRTRHGEARLSNIELYAAEPYDRDTLFAAEIRAFRKIGIRAGLAAMNFYGAKDLQSDDPLSDEEDPNWVHDGDGDAVDGDDSQGVESGASDGADASMGWTAGE
ncbi:hypothetical protein B0H11DRAFT_1927909 [Mycena galericulata]|nr:hypothetical protein B0H11DRAFT_1927909 [Mycena galericulata]